MQVPHPDPCAGRVSGGAPSRRGVGDHRAEHGPRTEPVDQEQRVLAEPTDPGPLGRRAVDERVVVADHHRSPPVRAEPLGDRLERQAHRRVVVAAGRASDPSERAVRRPAIGRWLGGSVAPGAHHERARAGEDPAGVGRALGVPIGELHPAVETAVLPLEQVATGLGKDLGRRHPDRDEPLRESERAELSGQPVGRVGRRAPPVGDGRAGHAPSSHGTVGAPATAGTVQPMRRSCRLPGRRPARSRSRTARASSASTTTASSGSRPTTKVTTQSSQTGRATVATVGAVDGEGDGAVGRSHGEPGHGGTSVVVSGRHSAPPIVVDPVLASASWVSMDGGCDTGSRADPGDQ